MMLGSDDGAHLDLRIVGYQFPAHRSVGTEKDWDANWLNIASEAVDEDGRSWSFRDPCLTTWEARRLHGWLRGVVDGSVPPIPFDGSDAERLTTFTEPNIAFSLAERTDDDVVIRAHLSLESRPPWLSSPSATFDYVVLLRMPVTRVTLATENWERMIAEYPVR